MTTNSFKRYTARSIGTAPTTVGNTIPANTQVTIIGLNMANVLPNTAISVTASLFDGINTTYIVTGALVVAGGSLFVDPKIVLMPGDSIRVSSSSANSVDVIMSTLEQV